MELRVSPPPSPPDEIRGSFSLSEPKAPADSLRVSTFESFFLTFYSQKCLIEELSSPPSLPIVVRGPPPEVLDFHTLFFLPRKMSCLCLHAASDLPAQKSDFLFPPPPNPRRASVTLFHQGAFEAFLPFLGVVLSLLVP